MRPNCGNPMLVGIRIDHRKAVIVSASADRVTVRTLESQVGPHSRYSGRAGSPAPEGGEDEGGEKKYEKRYRQHLDWYYDAVIGQLGHPEALLILRPGEAKLQLKERCVGGELPLPAAVRDYGLQPAGKKAAARRCRW